MRVVKNNIIEAVSNLEQMSKRLEIYIQELYQIKNNVAYKEDSYEIVKNLSRCISNIENQRKNILSVMDVLNTVGVYYDKCEKDSVMDLYEEMVFYKDIDSGEVDLSQIKDILKKFKMI